MALIGLLVVLVNADTITQCHSEPKTKNLCFDYYQPGASVVQLIGSAPIGSTPAAKKSDPVPSIKRPADPWLSADKFWHFALSLALTGSSYHFIRCRLNEPENRAAIYSLGFSFGCGLSKELYDSKKPRGYFSYKDLLYDLLGVGAGYLLFIHTYQ